MVTLFNFLNNGQTVFQKSWLRVPTFLHFLSTLVIVHLLILAILEGMKWCISFVVLVGMSLVTNNGEHFFFFFIKTFCGFRSEFS